MSELQSIKETIMKRDELSEQEANRLIAEATMQMDMYLEEGSLEEAYEICQEFFGLEPDYIFDLIV